MDDINLSFLKVPTNIYFNASIYFLITKRDMMSESEAVHLLNVRNVFLCQSEIWTHLAYSFANIYFY